MARDQGLEALLSDDLQDVRGLAEKTMFGGLAWLVHGNLLCGARQDGLLVRLGKDKDAWALKLPGIVPMLSGSRRMQGWVRVAPEAYADDALRRRLLDAALAFVRSLPAK
ncbi:MAG TPA: TfoX/Sxy family protein [Dyella sp.]|uniref:TfoX/Sxy family protein n=1 Tax=Dyella sp. TaxID=1869338 RepID=UPI002BF4EB90|nr:TfoX/Sxy family protein [Dyella sp.]HUB89560.1 TfoX/Sxy family protein [Dyella sp.]